MDTIRTNTAKKRPALISFLSISVASQGIIYLIIAIGMTISRRSLFHSDTLPAYAVDYLLQQVHTFPLQIALLCMIIVFSLFLAWGLWTRRTWAYWITVIGVLPYMTLYHLSKLFLILFGTIPAKTFEIFPEGTEISVSLFFLVLFLAFLKQETRRAFYT